MDVDRTRPRRGLPRVAGDDSPQPTVIAPTTSVAQDTHAPEGAAVPAGERRSVRRGMPRDPTGEEDRRSDRATDGHLEHSTPRTSIADRNSQTHQAVGSVPRTPPPSAPSRRAQLSRLQWAGTAAVGAVAVLIIATMAVLLARWSLSTPWGEGLLAAFPGEYSLPEDSPLGLPAWLGWQHFFNVFLTVLIIRSGLQVRRQEKPPAIWSPRWNPARRISITLWLHQSLDILWLVNGAVFVLLLIFTRQWMRIVPTSWEVFPNALSAALQYASLDWPTENGWVNYNALQQLAYFSIVFIAAPIAAISGMRMSGLWPQQARLLNRAYPVTWARAVHFPVMIYFVVFIFFHVVLVLSTGALRNLNHMYAAQGSIDGNEYAENWFGFWMFALSISVIAGAWIAARPIVLAPIARLFGSVSAR